MPVRNVVLLKDSFGHMDQMTVIQKDSQPVNHVEEYQMVNANLSEFERLNDTNHQYSDSYCVKCGHYPEVSYLREVDCECDCHD